MDPGEIQELRLNTRGLIRRRLDEEQCSEPSPGNEEEDVEAAGPGNKLT